MEFSFLLPLLPFRNNNKTNSPWVFLFGFRTRKGGAVAVTEAYRKWTMKEEDQE